MRGPILLTTSVPEALRAQAASEYQGTDGVSHLRTDRDVIVWCRLGQGSHTPKLAGPLSVRAVWHGTESYLIGRRALCVDEDSYLVINGGREHSVVAQRRDAVESLMIFFSNETRRAFETRGCDREFFAEHLRPHDDLVTPGLRGLLEARRSGITNGDWYAEQIANLYANLVAADDALHCKAVAFAPASLATRTELLRRVMTATDYVNSNYMSPVTLDDMASAAHLSKYHLARLFRTLHGVSPAAYLRMKRIRAAERLIERSNADLAEIAERSGFGSRWSMFRELRRRRGMSGQRIRESWTRADLAAISSAL
jgi:AraC-like DNA-binding protein